MLYGSQRAYAEIKELPHEYNIWLPFKRVCLGVKTYDVFICFVAIVRVRVYYVDPLSFSLFTPLVSVTGSYTKDEPLIIVGEKQHLRSWVSDLFIVSRNSRQMLPWQLCNFTRETINYGWKFAPKLSSNLIPMIWNTESKSKYTSVTLTSFSKQLKN